MLLSVKGNLAMVCKDTVCCYNTSVMLQRTLINSNQTETVRHETFEIAYTERKKFSKFFTSLVFVYKSMSLKRFHDEQLCPYIDSMI